MALQLGLKKEGTVVKPLQLGLKKGEKFTVELFWKSAHDLDAHALQAFNDGTKARISALEQVLSPYNLKKNDPGASLELNPDKSFSLPDGSLQHSGDCTNGKQSDIDEIITVDTGKLPATCNEIPVFVTIHDPDGKGLSFKDVDTAGVRIKNSAGKVLGEYLLTNEFATAHGVQFGSVCLGDSGWEFFPIGSAVGGDFNSILAYFSS